MTHFLTKLFISWNVAFNCSNKKLKLKYFYWILTDVDFWFHIKLVHLAEYNIFFLLHKTHQPNPKLVIEINSLKRRLHYGNNHSKLGQFKNPNKCSLNCSSIERFSQQCRRALNHSFHATACWQILSLCMYVFLPEWQIYIANCFCLLIWNYFDWGIFETSEIICVFSQCH